jgi:hypothetical protein
MKLAAFDLEIAKELPEDASDWKAHRPLGISCAAIQLSHEDPRGQTLLHYAGPQMTNDECQVLVAELAGLAGDGYTLVTWNGLGFDWDVLAEESGLHAECARLALAHVDLMFIVVAIKGHYLALDTACRGMGVKGKLKSVTLGDGQVLEGMSGAMAPALWAQGEHQAVLDYLADDVRSTLELAQAIERYRALRWISRRGRANRIAVPQLYSVEACLQLPLPDTGWMTSPPSRSQMTAWMTQSD